MKKYFIFGLVFLALISLVLMIARQKSAKQEVEVSMTSEEVFVEEEAEITALDKEVSAETKAAIAVAEKEVFVEEKKPTPKKAEVLSEKNECIILDDFTGQQSRLSWGVINDGVMGGLSKGSALLQENMLIHSGVINTNGGGFSNVWTGLPENILEGYTRLNIRLKTYGRGYAVNFNDRRYRNISHQAQIPIGPMDSWQEAFIDFSQTTPTFFSRRVVSEPFTASEINRLSFSMSDGVDGPFKMEIDWIKACV